MAKTVRVAKRNLQREKQSRRIKHIQGGVVALKGETNLSKIWNYMFQQRAPNLVIKELPKGSKKALFVIDMQNDFVDKFYDRKDPNENHPVWKNKMSDPTLSGLKDLFGGGNFAVAAGSEMIDDLVKTVSNALNDPVYTNIIFSRDYHPVGHSSFNKVPFYEQNLCGICNLNGIHPQDDGGVFPAHCVQGKEGTLIVEELSDLIKTNAQNTKLKIVFKGVHPHCDSYSAVQKENIDTYASNKLSKSTTCGSISGGYRLKNGENDAGLVESLEFNSTFIYEPATKEGPAMFKVIKDDSTFTLEHENYDYLNGVDVIEVCGLAGDYCVRDTVVALAKKYKNAQIVLLNDLTRYPVLPFGTISIVPQHRYLNVGSVSPEYKKELNRIKTNTNKTDRKDISDYLILMDGKKRLLTKEEVGNVNITNNPNPDYWVELTTENPPTGIPKSPIGHFITPSQVIIDEYKSFNGKIKVYIDPSKNIKPGVTKLPIRTSGFQFNKNLTNHIPI